MSINLEDLKQKGSKPQATFAGSRSGEIKPERVRGVLQQFKTEYGVVGYIMRNTKAASVDLTDPSRLVDYAILSSSAKESSQELLQAFGLGEIENVLIEGKDVKLLFQRVGDNDVSVFMEKSVEHAKISRTLSSLT